MCKLPNGEALGAVFRIPADSEQHMPQSFVLLIEKNTPGHIVERIGKKLTALNGQGIEAGVRTLDALLEDVRKGIPDNLLLQTDLKPYDLQDLLKNNLASDYQVCQVKWV
jgi:hypothetical protein